MTLRIKIEKDNWYAACSEIPAMHEGMDFIDVRHVEVDYDDVETTVYIDFPQEGLGLDVFLEWARECVNAGGTLQYSYADKRMHVWHQWGMSGDQGDARVHEQSLHDEFRSRIDRAIAILGGQNE